MNQLKPRFAEPVEHPKGFALIITISMMILLALLAVGLLSLSTVALRSSKQSDSMAVARANARMALTMAIGDLQKFAGPDQRITARADVLDENIANPRLTGIWKSWDIDANSPPSPSEYEDSQRNDKFLGWMTSSKDGLSAQEVDFAKNTPTQPATLWGDGSLGDNPDTKDIVRATKVPISSNPGAVAWAVMDEGVKARINTPYKVGASSSGGRSAQLGSGQRPNVASISALSKLESNLFEEDSIPFDTISKGISRKNMELAAEELAPGTGEMLKPLTHDVTVSSVGLLTNTAKGGLKEDFSLLTNNDDLPAPYDSGQGVYSSLLGMNSSSAPSDPRWESFHDLARLPIEASTLTSSGGSPVIRASVPSGWRAATGSNPSSGDRGTINREPPPGMTLLPTVARVEVVFSLLTRDIYNYPKPAGGDTAPKPPQSKAQEEASQSHNPWGKRFAGSEYDYLLHLIYTPVVTLHNPYNVTLEFEELKVVFGNVPFGLQMIRNGEAMTTEPAPLDKMFYQGAERGEINKRFGMTLKTNGGSSSRPRVGSSTFRMLPGEVIMFSPYIDPNLSWANNSTYADWRSDSNLTLDIDGIPGWRGDGIGFDLDWFCPADIRVSSNEVEGTRSMNRGGCLGARANDEWSLNFAPLSVPDLSDNKYTIEIFAKTDGRRQVSSSVIEMDYETPTGLQDSLLGPNGSITYPDPTKADTTINTMEMHVHRSTPMKEMATVKPFAIVSAQAKTTKGGLDPEGEDGQLGTKPWCFGHANVGAFSGNMVSEHPANHSHEFSIQRLELGVGTNNLMQYDPATGRGNFISGLTGFNGSKFGVQYDIPITPIQTLVGLNSANPGGSSGYLPRFAQPIGNSWAHPLINSSAISTNGPAYPYLDHSFLLNLAFYDRFYFSGLAEKGGSFNTASSTADLAQNLIDGEALSDPRLALYNPDGRPVSDFVSDVVGEDDAYSKVAAWQVVNGAFNINSTSVAAWKAMLGSIQDAEALFNQLDKSGESVALADLPATNTGANEARISRFRLPVSESEVDGADPIDAYWLGPREYTEDELERLAENIVEQVRERGPFLSMSEFVNRRLGSDDTAQRGALQQAIDDSNLNRDVANAANAGFDIGLNKVANYRYANPEAGTGPSYQGAPGYLSQADLLAVLGNAATPRSDTFTIRGFGEARDASDSVLATAMCEATVQRVPEYIDSSDEAHVLPVDLTSEANKTFGRRFQITAFRWLSANEI